MSKHIIIDEAQARLRTDVLVSNQFPTVSRAFLHKLFDAGKVTLNGEDVKPGHKLRLGEKIYIDFELNDLEKIPDIELPILYEDDSVIVINKPTGVISHSRGKYWNEPSVASFIRQKTGLDGERTGIVHRLDRATSGVMICAKNPATLSMLQKQFSLRKVKKTYTAVVKGHLEPAEAVIDMPIERNPKAPSTFRVGPNGKPSVTKYKVLKSSNDKSLLELSPTTGRTHQLRVHLQQLGKPIIGDPLYGGEPADRLMLHALSLEITIPESERKVFTAPLPEEFEKAVTA